MEDNNEFYEQMKKFFEVMQKEIANAVENYMDHDAENGDPQFIQAGFKIDIGPDGPRIQPINHAHPHSMSNNSSWEKPFTDVFLDEEEKRFHIIAEVPGIETEDVKFHFPETNKIAFQAEFDQFKYRKGLLLKHDIDTSSMEYSVRNGVLEIFVNVKQD